jgi:hypothetical protein
MMWETDEKAVLTWALVVAAVIGCLGLFSGCDEDPLVCELVDPTTACPTRRLLCCIDVETCDVETPSAVYPCDVADCQSALEAACAL